MMTFQELRVALHSELVYLLNMGVVDETAQYVNQLARNTSIYLTSILQEHLLMGSNDKWDPGKWLDDTLLTKIRIMDEGKLSIWGVVIWGKENTTEQWTEPVYFETILNESSDSLNEYLFLFGDLNYSEITYEEFLDNRDCWDRDFYSNSEWNPAERDWNYIVRG